MSYNGIFGDKTRGDFVNDVNDVNLYSTVLLILRVVFNFEVSSFNELFFNVSGEILLAKSLIN